MSVATHRSDADIRRYSHPSGAPTLADAQPSPRPIDLRMEPSLSPTHRASHDANRTTLRAILALFAFPVVGFGWALGYVFLIGSILDRGSLAFAATIVMLPILSLVAGVLWIVLVRGVEWRSNGRLPTPRRLLLTIPVALVLGFLLAGPRGFTLAPGAEMINIALMIVLSTGAIAYSWLARW